ncbi:ATP-binding protein [Leptolyngbya sp. NIES-2104]|uniref:ATP-binding protein n=1 Tax=Leptolyngbya sp. NIES-2104 TaxID=1552121 RepID=UPI0006EC664B|nr:anti-sigma regulatory factor [Leptolyngbya sp. NIES-2104]GAP95177.1 serine-protein kinase RsbW [Leptolyngbya sp. NIES-2104]
MNNLVSTEGVIHFDRLIVQTDLTVIPQILSWFEAFQRFPVSQVVWLQGQIALVEGFTNAVRHAHAQFSKYTPIEIEAGIYPNRLEIRVWDQGSPFDLAELIDRVEQDYPNPLEHEVHWGAALFKKLKDQHGWNVEYSCSGEGQNCLSLIKFY